MTTPLLELPPYQRQRLLAALTAEALVAPYHDVSVAAAIGEGAETAGVAAELRRLEQEGVGRAAVVYALTLAEEVAARVPRPDLVWSGVNVHGVHARKTRQVFDELIGGAERSLWISSYTYWDGAQAFAKLAERMDATPRLKVRLLLNVQRAWGDRSPEEALAPAFAEKLWSDWPGRRRPEVFYDPRALIEGAGRAVLHAKAVVADDSAAFITSANLTERAFDDNIEVGLLTRDRTVALSLARHFGALVERGLLEPLLD